VVIIARDEAAHIAACLRSISEGNYPKEKYEIILMDDHSNDHTIDIAQALNISNLQVLSLAEYDTSRYEGRFKKAGLNWAVKNAQYEHILQTDGDCVCPPDWIAHMVNTLQEVDIATGPVLITNSQKGLLHIWQTFDNIGTSVLTNAGIELGLWYSANAANMVYKKKVYEAYLQEEDSTLASGDDVFLINWADQSNYKIGFVKSSEAIVATDTEPTIRGLYHQRLRWATKTTSYREASLKYLMAGLFVFHISILIILILGLAFDSTFLIYFIIIISAKWIGDTVLLLRCAPSYRQYYPLHLSLILSGLHTIYVSAIGLLGLAKKEYMWKGRKVR